MAEIKYQSRAPVKAEQAGNAHEFSAVPGLHPERLPMQELTRDG